MAAMIWRTEAMIVCDIDGRMMTGKLEKLEPATEDELWHRRQDEAETMEEAKEAGL